MSNRRIFGLWLLALLVFSGSLIAANWQYQRHLTKKEFSESVNQRLASSPRAITDTLMIETWQPVSFAVTLGAESKLIRKRPLDGRNGLWLVNSAIHESGFRVPVLLGWLPASAGANVELEIPNLPQQKFQAIGVVRDFEALEEAVDLPKNQILTVNPTEISSDVPYFVQLTSPNMLLTPEFRSVPVPSISQGPHFFYAIQWLVFGVIALIGTAILTRQELNVKP